VPIRVRVGIDVRRTLACRYHSDSRNNLRTDA